MIVGYRSRSISFKFKSACRAINGGRVSRSCADTKHNTFGQSVCRVARNIKSITTPIGY